MGGLRRPPARSGSPGGCGERWRRWPCRRTPWLRREPKGQRACYFTRLDRLPQQFIRLLPPPRCMGTRTQASSPQWASAARSLEPSWPHRMLLRRMWTPGAVRPAVVYENQNYRRSNSAFQMTYFTLEIQVKLRAALYCPQALLALAPFFWPVLTGRLAAPNSPLLPLLPLSCIMWQISSKWHLFFFFCFYLHSNHFLF